MKKKRICMALAAALSLSLAVSATALAAIPSDIGGHWAQGTIIQWTTNGYISGYPDGTFKPDNSITRAEFVVMVNKAMGYNKRGNAYFSDVSAAHWAYAEIMKGVEAGYITGNGDGTFRPDAPVTRQEAAVMISKILGLDQDYASAAKYVDYRYIPSWAAGYVGAVSKAGIMTGYPDGDFKSDRVLTRAESVVSLDKTKNYDGKVEEDKDDREVFEDYRLTSSSLSDKIIKGDLIISSSLSNRNVSLDNVKVEGKLIVEGGKTVTADDCEISELEMNRSDVEFDATGRTKVGKTTFEKYGKLSGSGYSRVIIDEEFSSYIELDANIDYVELDADTNVRLLENCVIETFEATKNADNATVNFNKAEVEDMDIYDAIRITGKGDIKNMTVYKSGVKSSIRPDHLDRRNGASKPDYTSTSSGDVGYNPGSRYDDLTASRDKLYKGGRYDDVKVTADGGVTLKNMTIYGDLTIDEDVENGDVYLEDLDIRGHVYIYGGGEDTVSFEDCQIEGNIYAKKDHGSRPVGLKIDSSTAEDLEGYISIEDNGAILKAGGKLDKVYVLTGSTVQIDTNVKNLYVSANTSKLTITAGTTVDKLSISSSSAKDSTITNDGKINELNTSQDIKVDGNGTIKDKTGSGTVTTGDDQKISVKGVSLNATTATVEAGNTYQLTATVQPTNATNTNVTWSSDKTDIATVDEKGLVTAKAAGTANITVTTEDGSKTATCAVTVTAKEEETVAVTGVTISEREEVTVGNTLKLTATIAPNNATNKNVTWTSSAENVATISSDGTVTPVGVGKTTITVKTEDGEFTDTCEVTVKPNVQAEITGEDSVEMESTITLGANVTVNPSTTTYSNTWDSSNKAVATIDENGIVTPVSVGTTTITLTVKTSDNNEFTFNKEITVNAKPDVKVQTINVSGGNEVVSGEELQLSAMVLPEGATEKEVTWSTSNTQVATVDNNGKVTAKTVTENTQVTITATANDGSNVTGSINITVKPVAVTNISITKDGNTPATNESLEKDATLQLTATVTPDNAANKEVTWSVSGDTSAVELSKNQSTSGESITVTAKANGTATITATARGGENITDSIEITVNPKLSGITLEPTTATLEGIGTTTTITAKANPEGAELGTVNWNSSATEVATVQSNGDGTATVTAKASGTATITATSNANSEVKATCEVTVTVPVTGVTISAQGGTTTSPATLTPGGTLQLSAEVKPEDATNKTVTWSITSDPNEAVTLNSEGNTATVTAKSAGTATITAKVDETHSATFQITVQASTPSTSGDGDDTGTGETRDGDENGDQTGETTTQTTNNAIVVSR